MMHNFPFYIALAPFAMPVLIVAIVFIYKAFLATLKAQADPQNAEIAQRLDAVCARLDKMERRMANLETIVLDEEKRRSFERAL